MSDAIFARVRAIVAGVVPEGRLSAAPGPETPLGEEGLWLDSVDLLQIVVACEAEFGVMLEPDAAALHTLGSLTRLVRGAVTEARRS